MSIIAKLYMGPTGSLFVTIGDGKHSVVSETTKLYSQDPKYNTFWVGNQTLLGDIDSLVCRWTGQPFVVETLCIGLKRLTQLRLLIPVALLLDWPLMRSQKRTATA